MNFELKCGILRGVIKLASTNFRSLRHYYQNACLHLNSYPHSSLQSLLNQFSALVAQAFNLVNLALQLSYSLRDLGLFESSLYYKIHIKSNRSQKHFLVDILAMAMALPCLASFLLIP